MGIGAMGTLVLVFLIGLTNNKYDNVTEFGPYLPP